MKKIINIKHFRRLYEMNRLWGDGRIVAAYYALRGKAFTVQFASRVQQTQQDDDFDPEDAWWQAIK